MIGQFAYFSTSSSYAENVDCFGVPLKQVRFCQFSATPQTLPQNLERFQYMTQTLYLKTERPNKQRCMILRNTQPRSCLAFLLFIINITNCKYKLKFKKKGKKDCIWHDEARSTKDDGAFRAHCKN